MPARPAFSDRRVKRCSRGKGALRPAFGSVSDCGPAVPVSLIIRVGQLPSNARPRPSHGATSHHGGDTWNVIPDRVLIRGTVRCFDAKVQDRAEDALRSMATTLAAAQGATANVEYSRRYPATVNSSHEADNAIAAAKATRGSQGVCVGIAPSMASEAFAFMLQALPGAYIWLGADGRQPSAPLHNPHYDFNDETLAVGAAYWVSLAKYLLPVL